MKYPLVAAVGYLLLLAMPALAQVSPLINYQGRVAVSGVNFEGPGQFKFALVNADGSVTYWSNDLTSAGGSEPADAVSLTVEKGLYSVLLGDVALVNMAGLPANVFTNPDVRLRVWFDDGLNGSQLLSPDQRLAPAAYFADGAVTSTAISDAAITSGKIAAGAVTGTHIAPASLDFSLLTVPAAPDPGQVLSFDGTSFAWAAPGGGSGVFTLNGTSAYYNGGKVGIGTSTPASKLTVYTYIGTYAFGTTPGVVHTDGNVSLGTSIGSFNFADGGGFGTFSNHPLNFFVNNGAPSMTIDGNGTSIVAGLGTVSFGSPNGESGITIRRQGLNNRADLRYDGTSLKLVAGIGTGPPGNGIVITNAGNVSIGSTAPVGKLEVVAQDALRLIGYQPFLTLFDSSTGYARGRIQSVGGDLDLFTESYLNGSNTNNYAKLFNSGNFSVKTLTIRGGADFAEPFQMKEDELETGSVVIIDSEHPGRLKRSTNSYDTRVAGIVSGANGIHPGISLHQEGAVEGGQNVALSGRVYVQADTSNGAIQPGDLLTTSVTPGHAMKVTDHTRSQGAVIGKAMSALEDGSGMVLVLVTLQ